MRFYWDTPKMYYTEKVYVRVEKYEHAFVSYLQSHLTFHENQGD